MTGPQTGSFVGPVTHVLPGAPRGFPDGAIVKGRGEGAEVGKGIAENRARVKYGGSDKRLSKRGVMFTPRETMQDCGVVRGTRVIPPGK